MFSCRKTIRVIIMIYSWKWINLSKWKNEDAQIHSWIHLSPVNILLPKEKIREQITGKYRNSFQSYSLSGTNDKNKFSACGHLWLRFWEWRGCEPFLPLMEAFGKAPRRVKYILNSSYSYAYVLSDYFSINIPIMFMWRNCRSPPLGGGNLIIISSDL